MQEKPYWTMSRLDLPRFQRFDWLYNSPPPKVSSNSVVSSKRKQKSAESPLTSATCTARGSKPDVTVIELVGYKPSEYQAAPQRPPLRGATVPWEHGRRDAFRDMHTPVQITQKYNGGPILSVPIRRMPIPGRISRESFASLGSSASKAEVPIHEVLFEESVDPHEDIDPWGYSRNEKVVAPDATFRGVRLTVSRLHPVKN
jgi:hypothetical protein